jgi:REP element-mobilizing transposase RayT
VVEGGLYHLYNRFARGESVFADPEETLEFVERLREVKQRDSLTIFAWALLSNHYHLAIRTAAVPLSRTMQHLQGGYSRAFNRRWRRTGPLWQSRYQARLVEDQGYFDQVMVYIHLNPVRAGLVEEPAEYVFSGHRELMGRARNPLVDVDEALVGFGDTLKEARREYASRIGAALEQEPTHVERLGRARLFGRDRTLEPRDTVFVDELGRSTGRERPRLEGGQFLDGVCTVLGVEIEQLGGRRRDSETARTRQLVASVGIERWGQRAGELASLLDKHSVSVSRWVSEAARRRVDEPGFGEEIERLDHRLSEWASAARKRGELSTVGRVRVAQI